MTEISFNPNWLYVIPLTAAAIVSFLLVILTPRLFKKTGYTIERKPIKK